MANLFLGNEFQSPVTSTGAVNNGGFVHFYERGTSTRKNTYADNALATPNANPLVLNSLGRGVAFLQGIYKVRIEDSAGNLIKELDDVNDINTLTDADRFNKVVNGDFEQATISATLPDNWTVTLYSGGTAAIDATDRHSGVQSLKFTSTGTGGGYAVTNSFIAVAANEQANVFFSLKSSVADVRNVVEILWYTSAQVLVSTTTVYDNSTTNPTTWTYKNVTANAPATAYYAKLRITGCHSSDATAGSTWFDAVSLQTDFILDRPNTFTDTQTMSGAQLRLAKGADIASAATVDLSTATGNNISITGTGGPITSFGNVQAGAMFFLTTAASVTVTHNATSMICPNAKNIVTQAGDRIAVESIGSGNWRVWLHKPQLVSRFRAYQSASQTVGTAGDEKILFQTKTIDNLNEFDTSTSLFTAKSPGTYLFVASVYWAASADGERHGSRFFLNGASYEAPSEFAQGAAVVSASSGTLIIDLVAGDTVGYYGSTSVARATTALTNTTYFSGVRLG